MKKIIQKTFSYRLKPLLAQRILCMKNAGCARFVYNFGLGAIKKALDGGTNVPTYEDQANLLPSLKKTKETEWLKEVNSQALQQSLMDLYKAMNNFYRGQQQGKEIGFPKFKCKGKKDSFRFPQSVKCANGKVYLPKIGWVRYHDSRPIEGKIKQATVKRKGEHWYIHITCKFEIEIGQRTIRPEKVIGIDLGLTHFAYTSDGQIFENPKHLLSNMKRLQCLQRSLSRKKRGSSNRKKAVKKVGKQHEKVANQRKDYIHKVSTAIIENQDGVIVENLNIKGMVKNRRLSRAISDAGWYGFISALKYKADWQDKRLIIIDRFSPTTKLCSACGHEKNMPLSMRRYSCEVCGLTLDRDLNAAINIKAAGLAVLSCGGTSNGLPGEAGIAGF